MVVTVAVHYRDTMRTTVAHSAFGDIGDCRVEHPRSAGNRGVSEPGTFMRGATPVGRPDDESLARKLAALVEVVDVAADREASVRARLHEPCDQSLGTRTAPFGE